MILRLPQGQNYLHSQTIDRPPLKSIDFGCTGRFFLSTLGPIDRLYTAKLIVKSIINGAVSHYQITSNNFNNTVIYLYNMSFLHVPKFRLWSFHHPIGWLHNLLLFAFVALKQ